MPLELIATAPRTPELRTYEERPLQANEIRVRTELASPKHGTELVFYRNDPVASRPYDAERGAVVPADEDRAKTRFPMSLGNMAVGEVTEVGADVTRFAVGNRVFGHLPIRETQTVDERRVDVLPDGISPEAAVCLDPVVMALAIRDGGIKLGDRVAVFGLGAIGLIGVQLARLAGASHVIGLDPLENRRALASAYGADVVLDPTANGGDAGMMIRELTPPVARYPDDASPRRIIGGYAEELTQHTNRGVDVAVETSGSIAGLQQAIRATRFGGTVCVVSFYGREASGLLLGEEFHINRLQLVSVRAQSLPMRDSPGWTLERLVDLGLAWLADGRLQTAGILNPIVPIKDAANAYRMIDERPAESIKLGIRFD